MSLSDEIFDNLEIAKNYLLNSKLSDDDKNMGLKILNISKNAVRNQSAEEKIQKISECIFWIFFWNMRMLGNFDNAINEKLKSFGKKDCENCIAYKHALAFEKQKNIEDATKSYLKSIGMDPNQDLSMMAGKKNKKNSKLKEAPPEKWVDFLKLIFLKPYPYIFLSFAVFSPHIVEILKIIFNKF